MDLALCRRRHQVITQLLAAALTAAVEMETLLQLLLPFSRKVQEVHIAEGQLLTLGDLPQSSQLHPGGDEGISFGGVSVSAQRPPVLKDIWIRWSLFRAPQR